MGKKNNKIFLIAFLILCFLWLFPVIAAFKMEKNYINEIHTISEFESIDNGYVYFGRDACPQCVEFAPLLFKIANETRTHVNYFNTDYFRKNSICSEETLQAIFDEYSVVGVPILITIKDGKFNKVVSIEISEDKNELERNIRKVIYSTSNH